MSHSRRADRDTEVFPAVVSDVDTDGDGVNDGKNISWGWIHESHQQWPT